MFNFFQDELDNVAEVWDFHLIRPSRNHRVPHGRPNIMYHLPHLQGTTEKGQIFDPVRLETCKEECTFRVPLPCDADTYQDIITLMSELNISMPSSPNDRIDLYLELRNVIKGN